jgi:hypothetical protein
LVKACEGKDVDPYKGVSFVWETAKVWETERGYQRIKVFGTAELLYPPHEDRGKKPLMNLTGSTRNFLDETGKTLFFATLALAHHSGCREFCKDRFSDIRAASPTELDLCRRK